MTIEEISILGKELGHEPSNEEIHECSIQKNMKIKKFCNMHMWSDVHPYEVVKVISDKTIEVKGMLHKQVIFPKDFCKGGFSGHYADNHAQKYEYSPNPEAISFRVRFSRAKNRWQSNGSHFIMSDNPFYFYDYNF